MLRPSLVLRSLCLLLTIPALFAQEPDPVTEPGTGLIFDLPSYREVDPRGHFLPFTFIDLRAIEGKR